MSYGPVIVAVLAEALRKFGRIDTSNRDQVGRWVKRRVDTLVAEANAKVVEEKEDPRLPSGDRA